MHVPYMPFTDSCPSCPAAWLEMARISSFPDQLISLDILGGCAGDSCGLAMHTSACALNMSRRARIRGQHYWNKVGGIFRGNKYIKYDNMLSMPTLS